MRIGTVLALLICATLIYSAVMAEEIHKEDSLIIEKTASVKDGNMAVKIDFVNDWELAAVTIPIKVEGQGVKIDSISFAGSRVEYLKTRPVTIAKDGSKVVFGAICMTEDYIAPGRGLLATVYISGSDSSKSKNVMVDTTTIHPASLLFTKSNSSSYIPQFISGTFSFAPPAKPEKTEAGN